MITALKNLLTNVWDKKYIAALHDNYIGYNNQTIQNILSYLYQNYGNLNETDLEEAEKVLNTPFDPIEPFSIFVKRVEDTMDLAEATGAPYIANQIVNKTFNLIIKA